MVHSLLDISLFCPWLYLIFYLIEKFIFNSKCCEVEPYLFEFRGVDYALLTEPVDQQEGRAAAEQTNADHSAPGNPPWVPGRPFWGRNTWQTFRKTQRNRIFTNWSSNFLTDLSTRRHDFANLTTRKITKNK